MTLDELKTILALNGNKRLPHLESEIFTSSELYTCYLESLCSKYWWFESYIPDAAGQLPWLAVRYAREVIHSRWPEAEKVIATDPEWAYRYATGVIKGRWPEAEATIAAKPQYAYYYAFSVIGGRWPEAEVVIATNRVCARNYNYYFGTNI
jgi:hypothetical protein